MTGEPLNKIALDHGDILTDIRTSKKFEDDVKDRTVEALKTFAKQFA